MAWILRSFPIYLQTHTHLSISCYYSSTVVCRRSIDRRCVSVGEFRFFLPWCFTSNQPKQLTPSVYCIGKSRCCKTPNFSTASPFSASLHQPSLFLPWHPSRPFLFRCSVMHGAVGRDPFQQQKQEPPRRAEDAFALQKDLFTL